MGGGGKGVKEKTRCARGKQKETSHIHGPTEVKSLKNEAPGKSSHTRGYGSKGLI